VCVVVSDSDSPVKSTTELPTELLQVYYRFSTGLLQVNHKKLASLLHTYFTNNVVVGASKLSIMLLWFAVNLSTCRILTALYLKIHNDYGKVINHYNSFP
jgi:hypothetical protein